MSEQVVSYVIEDEIAIITINNPPMNPLTNAVREQILEIMHELREKQDEIKVVILTGTGKAFVAGADIKSFPDLTQETAKARLKKTRVLYQQMEDFTRPVICAVNGFCLGGGLELAMTCDIRIAATTAQFGQPEINLGIIPGGGGTQRLPRLVGSGIAKELIYTGQFISAERAEAIGLVNKVVEPEDLMTEAKKMANRIAGKPMLAVRAAKEAINHGLNMTLHEGLDLESMHWSYLCGTEDQKEGAHAFIEKRKPKFVGR
ncbi:MAG: enoyl-CoA hydratase/isomerase family protein [Deltaproteobacteria bacterium]|nr:enoyl-CoA hydratase/isomerase family protein [Deltaproteobacteria bacterium]MBN2687101.1 enoyl-CoA hydratase/isomerase family protein [Deltaproteobacteria bacterium]